MTDKSAEDCTCKRCVTRTICDSEKALNSVSKIDRVSRVVFPTTYIVINIIYWSVYTGAGQGTNILNIFPVCLGISISIEVSG